MDDGSCVRLRSEKRNHAWAYDFVHIRTRDGRAVRLLTIIDEYTGECRSTFARTTVPSSLPMLSVSGSGGWEQRHCTSSPGRP